MSSRDKDTKSLQDKLKEFFKKGASAPLPAKNELTVTPDLERELSAETPVNRRLRALRDVGEKAKEIRVQEGGVKKLWHCTRDLLEDSNQETRHTALWFMRCLAEGQADNLLIMRTIFFRYLKETHPTHPPEDSHLRFKLLHTLTETGKNIKCFEEQIGPFLLEWLPTIQNPAQTVEFLQLIINVVKYNAAYLDEDIVHGIVNNACHLCVYSAESGVVQSCLSLLEAVVGYSLLPRAALRTFVAALCRTVNLEHYCQSSWKLMRGVVGADIGHAALQEMVELAGGDAETDAGLVRGAVFYMNMALWGPRRVPTLRVSHLAVLPAFLRAVRGRRPVVTYEVVVAVQSLVTRVPLELHEPAWDLVVDIARAVADHDRSLSPPNELIHSRLHALISSMEQLQDAGNFGGSADALLALADSCGHERPEAAALRLISLAAGALTPARADWLARAHALADKYARRDPRVAVRLHALQTVHLFIKRHLYLYAEEVVERVGVPVLSACAQDAEVSVRAACARVAADLAVRIDSDACIDLVDLLEKILNRPFEICAGEAPLPAEADAGDLRLAAGGLLDVFRAKLLRPPATHATRCYLVLLDHLDNHYRRPTLLMHHAEVRIKILELLFSLRVNAFNGVGLAEGRARPACSPFVLVEPVAVRGQPAREAAPGGVLPTGRAARALVGALTRDSDWQVVGRVLRALPTLLQARAPALGRRAPELDLLASTLCAMVCDRSLNFPECLRAPPRLTGSEFRAAVLPALAAFAPYHAFLEPVTQQRIVRCLLKHGMVLRTPQPYIGALTLFTLETRDTMVKMLPEVLLDLSKISDTQAIAGPMLEFLSTLTRLPRVFASFVEDQYMSVFAIVLPYTNPSRYNHYVVSLAHHVIAAWFLKCRLSYRRNFVRFIIHGLHNYIIVPFEEQLQSYKPAAFQQGAANEDSSNRKRSSSLGSKGVTRAPLGSRAGGGGSGAGSGASASAALHVELTETCVDLLARYTFTPCSVKPQRSETADFIFTGGHSNTWLVGHKLITITTSGCLQNTLKQGPCDRCAALCRQHADSVPPNATPATPQPQAEVKRYSKRSLQHSRSTDTSSSSLSISEAGLAPPAHRPSVSGASSRQNSSERSGDPALEALSQLTQRFERISREVDSEAEATWPRVGRLVAGGACPCWCANWAEVHVRSPTGDVSWVMRMQNQMSWDYLLESPLQDVMALLSPVDARSDAGSEAEGRSRSGSASQPRRRDLELAKSSSDSTVTRPPPRRPTQPINIPGSPQRQSSSSTTDDDDLLLVVPEGKSRQPVRRSNSSPEMSSSWKLSGDPPVIPPGEGEEPPPPTSCEPASTSMSLHASKKAMKKSDMRVSCEAIPEEMCGTSPLHPHLCTYNSDPGTFGPEGDTETTQTLAQRPPAMPRTAPQTVPTASTEDLPPLSRSKRSNTISVMSPTRRQRPAPGEASGGASGGGVTPAFVLLQLFHNMSTCPLTPPAPGESAAGAALNPAASRPLKVTGEQHERTVKTLDLLPPVETYKVGVVYVGPGQQDDEVAILKNEHGSVRYAEFLRRLGSPVALEGERRPDLFLNLERDGQDGRYAYVWCDDVMQVQFHVATAMPSLARDPLCNEKRKYIGNDFVCIVYNESGGEFPLHTIKGQCAVCLVEVEPLEAGLSRVTVRSRDERVRALLAHCDAHVASDAPVALLARQTALHCALAAQIAHSLAVGGAPFASNALERLRAIKRLRRRLEAERAAAAARAPKPYSDRRELAKRQAIDDFNDYT